jgi:hypothetical protein
VPITPIIAAIMAGSIPLLLFVVISFPISKFRNSTDFWRSFRQFGGRSCPSDNLAVCLTKPT